MAKKNEQKNTVKEGNRLKLEPSKKWKGWSQVTNVKPPETVLYCQKCEGPVKVEKTEVWTRNKGKTPFYVLYAVCPDCGADLYSLINAKDVEKMIA